MSKSIDFDEMCVQKAVEQLQADPTLTVATAARNANAPYFKVYRRLRGIAPSSSRGGHNKKLAEVEDRALIDHLLMCHYMGKGAGVDVIRASANSILRSRGGVVETVSHRWAKRWLYRNEEQIQTLKSKPLSPPRVGSKSRD